MSMGKSDDPMTLLRETGRQPDGDVDIGPVALALGALDHPGLELSVYRAHLRELGDATRQSLLRMGEAATVEMVAGTLAGVVSGMFSYRGDTETYDDMQNADLVRVIERRKGLPVALGILYLHAARRSGLDLVGLNFPGHFVLRLTVNGQALVIDPFNGGQALNAAALRHLLQEMSGQDQVALTPEVYQPVSDRDILLRLQNNILGRAAKSEDFVRARSVVRRMLLIAPQRAELHFELGRIALYESDLDAAMQAFLECVGVAEANGDRIMAEHARDAMARIRQRLH